MTMLKRFGLFLMVNILIVVTISIILNLLGVGHYMTSKGINYESLMIFCLVWGMGGAFISLLLSKFMAKMMMGVQIIEQNGPYGELVSLVHQLSRRAGLTTMPEVGVYESPEINAFATGPTRSNSLVAVSTGLLGRMDREEVEGVIGHEVAHIANGDMVTMTLLQGVINAFVMFAARALTFMVEQALRNNSDDEKSAGGLGFFARLGLIMLFEMVFGLLGSMVVAAFSRYREYRADAGSARLTGKDKMIKALRALQANYETLMAQPQEQENFRSMQISSKSSFLALFSSHPALEDRIDALMRSRY